MIWPDVTELEQFYDSHLGQLCTRSLRQSISQIWPHANGETIVGLGYPLPILRPFLKSADVVIAAMPAAQGVIHWPRGSAQVNHAVLTHETTLPFRSGTLNRLILLHVLEHAQRSGYVLKEVERCLTPSGRALLLIPNRRNFWARAEHTPYAHGQPYSLIQLRKLLNREGFKPIQSKQALFFPPLRSRTFLKFSPIIERLGRKFFPHFGGMLLVEIEKRTEAPVKGLPVKPFATATNTAPNLNRNLS